MIEGPRHQHLDQDRQEPLEERLTLLSLKGLSLCPPHRDHLRLSRGALLLTWLFQDFGVPGFWNAYLYKCVP